MKLRINKAIIITIYLYILSLTFVTQNRHIINIIAIIAPFIYVGCMIGFGNMIKYISDKTYIDNFEFKYAITIFLYVFLLLAIMFSDLLRAIAELSIILFALFIFL